MEVNADHFTKERHALLNDPVDNAALPGLLQEQILLLRDENELNGKASSVNADNETETSNHSSSNHSNNSDNSDPGSPPSSSHGKSAATAETADVLSPILQNLGPNNHGLNVSSHDDSHGSGSNHSDCGRGSGDGHPHRTLKLGAARRNAFLTSVKNDTAWLEHHDIMDYSLLLGVGVCPRSKVETQHNERAARLEQRCSPNEYDQATDALANALAENVTATVAFENQR